METVTNNLRLLKGSLIAMAILALALSAFSLRYLSSTPFAAPRNVALNPFASPWLPVHATLSSVALAIGAIQFLRRRAGRWHRWFGRLYVVTCLLSAPAGLILAIGATTGPIATAGFGLLSIVWFVATGLAYKAARDGRYLDHRKWMIRSYSLTFGAVTLRIYLATALAAHLDFVTAYRAISFLAWVPNLMFAELWLRKGRCFDAAGVELLSPGQPRVRRWNSEP